MGLFNWKKKKKPSSGAPDTAARVLAEVERLRLAKAKSQAMAVLEVAYRNKEITAFDYERERQLLLNEFD